MTVLKKEMANTRAGHRKTLLVMRMLGVVSNTKYPAVPNITDKTQNTAVSARLSTPKTYFRRQKVLSQTLKNANDISSATAETPKMY